METPRLIDRPNLTDAELADLYAPARRVWMAALPGAPFPPLTHIVAQMRSLPKARTSLEWVVEGGYVSLSWQNENPDCQLGLAVEESARRRGLGTELLEFAIEQARAAGRTTLIGWYNDDIGAVFADQVGARVGNTMLISTLALPAEISPRPVPGYTVRSWQGSAPEELLESWIAVLDAINDAPHTEGSSPNLYSPEVVREQEELAAALGQELRVTVAVAQDGQVAASTVSWVEPELYDVAPADGSGSDVQACAIALTGASSVLAEHRGKGLARWIKHESLAGLMADRPEVSIVRTHNARSNAAILAVNYAVGFQTIGWETQAVLDL